MSQMGPPQPVVASADLRRIDEFRRAKNTSVLVVMFTDIAGSTRFAEVHGEDAYDALRREHNRILLEIIERDAAGCFVKNIGDAIMAVFAKPSEAVERALEIQRSLRQRNAIVPASERIVVRIGMHMGQVARDEATSVDVFGRHVNRAARVEALAPPGHVLITRPVYDSARGWIDPQRHAFVEHGPYRLKGIPEPVDLIEPFERGALRPRTPKLTLRERVQRWPLLPMGLLVAGAAFLALLDVFITPLIYARLAKEGVTLDTPNLWGTGGYGWITPAFKLARALGDYGHWLWLVLGAVLLGDQLLHRGIAVVRRRYTILMACAVALALAAGIIYFAQTVAMALMLDA
ncbi:MAG: adenylate/guanylate cyclase domain-containing protein [Proteobacteria bacterium]|nr:adenylate/guanylate cyclase domain-containing protein [Pseudomonadota bacterium]